MGRVLKRYMKKKFFKPLEKVGLNDGKVVEIEIKRKEDL